MSAEEKGFLDEREFCMSLLAVWLRNQPDLTITITQADLDAVAYTRIQESWDGKELVLQLFERTPQ